MGWAEVLPWVCWVLKASGLPWELLLGLQGLNLLKHQVARGLVSGMARL